jgi:hypothetical protein
VEGDRAHVSPCGTTRLLLSMAAGLTVSPHETLAGITAAWTEMTALAGLISSFAALLTPDLDIQAAAAALTLPYHNDRTVGRPRALIQLCAFQACAAGRGRLLQR